MSTPAAAAPGGRERDLLFLRQPRLWPNWPFLALVRRRPGRDEELGLLFDAGGAAGLYGYSSTVWLSNLFLIPATLEEFLALPKETFDTPEEIADASWSVD